MGPSVSPRSRASLAAIGRTVIASSQDAGWTSLLVDHHVVRPDDQVVQIPPTPDLKVLVGVRGAQLTEAVRPGRSRRTVYGAGSVGLTGRAQDDSVRRRRAPGFATFEKINIYVPAATVAEVGALLGRRRQALDALLPSAPFRERTVVGVAEALVVAMGRGAPDLYAESAAQWLVTHLLTGDTPQRWSSLHGRRDPTVSRARLAGVVELIQTAYAEPLSLDRLSAEAGISKYHLSRLFRRATGSTPHAFLVRTRLEAAAQLLVDTDLTVAQVARRCGFTRAAHFGAAFTRYYGLSPHAYRQQP